MQFWLLKCYRNFVVRRHGVYRLMIFVSHWVFVFRLFIYQACTHLEITALYGYIYVLFVLSRDKNKLVVFLMEEMYRFLYILLSRILFPRRKSTLSLTGPLPVFFPFFRNNQNKSCNLFTEYFAFHSMLHLKTDKHRLLW